MDINTKGSVLVEYESTPIRHAITQCPGCGRWFYINHILYYTEKDIKYDYQLTNDIACVCPVCKNVFYTDSNDIEEKSFDEMPHICVEKSIWE